MFTQMFACLIFILIIALSFKVARQKLQPLSWESWRGTWAIARRGLPASVMYLLDLVSLEIVVIVSNFISTEHLAANGALMNFFYVVIVFAFGVQGSAGPLVGRAMGAGDIALAR